MSIIIVPEKINGIIELNPNENLGCKRLPHSYLHGKLETEVGFDLFLMAKFNPEWDFDNTDTIPKGIYDCKYKGKECLLYVWQRYFSKGGICVYKDDIEGNMYAYRMYFTDVKQI